MKKLILFFSLLITALGGQAQAVANNPEQPVKIGTGIPAYRILTTDSNYATPANLKKHRKLMLIYFSPDCPHCQHLTEEMKPKIKELGDTQIVMITWSANFDIRAIKDFVRDYGLKKYPNITVGTEGYTFVVKNYFNVQTTPYIAIYNSNGKLAKAFDKGPEIDKLVTAVKNADK